MPAIQCGASLPPQGFIRTLRYSFSSAGRAAGPYHLLVRMKLSQVSLAQKETLLPPLCPRRGHQLPRRQL